MNAPAWRIWLVTAMMCAWGILSIRFVQKEMWPMALLCVAMAIVNAITLWRLTRHGK